MVILFQRMLRKILWNKSMLRKKFLNDIVICIPKTSTGKKALICESVLDETDCISHSTNTLGKGMNPSILPPAMGK